MRWGPPFPAETPHGRLRPRSRRLEPARQPEPDRKTLIRLAVTTLAVVCLIMFLTGSFSGIATWLDTGNSAAGLGATTICWLPGGLLLIVLLAIMYFFQYRQR